VADAHLGRAVASSGGLGAHLGHLHDEAVVAILSHLTRVQRVSFAAAHPSFRRVLFAPAFAHRLWPGILRLCFAHASRQRAGGGWRASAACAQCGAAHAKACTGCRAVWFCGKPCMKRAWQAGHREVCQRIGRCGGCTTCGALFDQCCCPFEDCTASCSAETEAAMVREAALARLYYGGEDDQPPGEPASDGAASADEMRNRSKRYRSIAEDRAEALAAAARPPSAVARLTDRWLCSLPEACRAVVTSHATRLILAGDAQTMVGLGAVQQAAASWPRLVSLSLMLELYGGNALAASLVLSQLPRLAAAMPRLEHLGIGEPGMHGLTASLSLDGKRRPLALKDLLGAFPSVQRVVYPTDRRGAQLFGGRSRGDNQRGTASVGQPGGAGRLAAAHPLLLSQPAQLERRLHRNADGSRRGLVPGVAGPADE
jgi:hypothetical protein